jgi:hypothetical protein
VVEAGKVHFHQGTSGHKRPSALYMSLPNTTWWHLAHLLTPCAPKGCPHVMARHHLAMT